MNFPNIQFLFKIAGIALIAIGLIHYEKYYTSWTSLLSGIALLIAGFNPRTYYSAFGCSFLVLLIPFCIVNGILTGTGIPEEVVWYNNAENSGIRFFSIPIEDFAYGFLMIFLNVMLFEAFSNSSRFAVPKLKVV